LLPDAAVCVIRLSHASTGKINEKKMHPADQKGTAPSGSERRREIYVKRG